MTVRFSSDGCQCGATLAPAGCLMRMTKGPDFSGSPDSTANFAFGPPGGKGCHLIAAGVSMTCPAGADVPAAAGAAVGSALCRHDAQPTTAASAPIRIRRDDLFIGSSY